MDKLKINLNYNKGAETALEELSIDMKQVVFCCFLFFLNTSISLAQDMQGVWKECTGIDSLEVLDCKRPFKGYSLDKEGVFIGSDSMVCNSQKIPMTGKWKISGNQLTIIHDTNRCLSYYTAQTFRIIWMNKDLFYSVSIGTVDWQGERIFTVFKRAK